MARLNRRLDMIQLTKQQLDAIAGFVKSRDDILALYLYGSYGSRFQTPLSDVDLAILPMPRTKWTARDEMMVFGELISPAMEDDVNPVNLATAPVDLQMRILDTGTLLYVRDRSLLADFQARVVLRYCDFRPVLDAIYRDYDTGLREELHRDR